MGDDHGSNGIGERILVEVLGLGTRLGRVEAEVAGNSEHLRMIDRRLECGSSQMHAAGTRIEQQGARLDQLQKQLEDQAIESQQRRKRCSEMMRKLGAAVEDTGVHVIQQEAKSSGASATWKQIAFAVGLAASLCGLTAAVQKCKPAAGAVPVDASRR